MGDDTDLYEVRINSGSAEATANLARRIGDVLKPGDTLLFSGPVGAGKSHFCRALIQDRLAAVGLVEDVPSPTFTLVQTYAAGPVELWHADLYRLSDPDEVLELGLEDAFGHAICLVEWPDRLGGATPADTLHVAMAPMGAADTRQITLRGPRDPWQRRLNTVVQHA